MNVTVFLSPPSYVPRPLSLSLGAFFALLSLGAAGSDPFHGRPVHAWMDEQRGPSSIDDDPSQNAAGTLIPSCWSQDLAKSFGYTVAISGRLAGSVWSMSIVKPFGSVWHFYFGRVRQ